MIRYTTGKKGKPVAIPAALYPPLAVEIERVPGEERIGPMVKDERTGRPYAETAFSQRWREIADAASVPREVWNRDSRAGGISEGRAAHSDPRVTAPVYDRSDVEAASPVAQLRVARRNGSETA